MPIGAAFSLWKKSVFIKHAVNSLSLSPLGHSDSFASCKAWCVLISASLPKTPFPRERLCMLGWLCIVQNLWAYTPGIRTGAILLGLPPLVQARMLAVSHTRPLHDAVAQMADDLYGGFAPATPFLNKQEVYRQTEAEQMEICSAYILSFSAYCTRSPYTTPSPTVLI